MDYPQCKYESEQIIKRFVESSLIENRLRQAMDYSLDGGKRLRATITLAVLQQCQPGNWQLFKDSCIVSELVHTSSLVIDDLPAFDNADLRREKKCVHLIYGEGLAYLLSFTMVTEALLILHKQLPIMKEVYGKDIAFEQYEKQIANLVDNISSRKAIGGQLLSTFHTSGKTNMRDIKTGEIPKMSKEEICDILYKKTSSFFEIALVTGWTVGNGDVNKLPELRKLGDLLGLCYQIYDDFLDYDEDVNGDNFSHNYVYHRGLKAALVEYHEYEEQVRKLIKELNLECPVFDYFLEMLDKKITSAATDLRIYFEE